MPRVILLKSEEKHQTLRRSLLGAVSDNGKTMTEIAKILGYGDHRAAKGRLRNPANITIGEMSKLKHNLHIPIDDLMQGIREAIL